MYIKNLKRDTPLSDEGNKKLIDAKKSKLESHHQEEQLDILKVCSKNGHEKKSNEIVIKYLEDSNKGIN